MIDSVNIRKIIKSQSTGTADSVAQAFSQNYYTKISPKLSDIFEFEYPAYNLEGATYQYYAQNLNSLSTNLNNGKTYSLNFTANTESISGLTILQHELYRIDYEDFKEAMLDSGGSAFTETMLSSIANPLIVFTDTCSGTTGVAANMIGNKYSYTFPTRVKPAGNYTIELFKDKSQYFIDSKFVFPKPVDNTIGDILTYSGESSGNSLVQLIDYYKSEHEFISATLGEHTISGNTPFSGLTIRGAFFTYIVPPQKPVLNVGGGNQTNPVSGSLPTFSPTWNFNNVNDGDYYRLQVTYDTTDFNFQDSSKVDFYINKQEGEAEFVRTYSTPLTPNQDFLYRVGNTKEITNIFGVRQAITTWADSVQARTANDGRYNLSGTTYRAYIWDGVLTTGGTITGATWISGVTLELIGIQSNSSVDLFVDTIAETTIFQEINTSISQQSSVITTTYSDANGNFDFGRIDGGTYTLRITPPVDYVLLYPTTTRTINISGDSDIDIILSIIWGNTLIDFSEPQTFL